MFPAHIWRSVFIALNKPVDRFHLFITCKQIREVALQISIIIDEFKFMRINKIRVIPDDIQLLKMVNFRLLLYHMRSRGRIEPKLYNCPADMIEEMWKQNFINIQTVIGQNYDFHMREIIIAKKYDLLKEFAGYRARTGMLHYNLQYAREIDDLHAYILLTESHAPFHDLFTEAMNDLAHGRYRVPRYMFIHGHATARRDGILHHDLTRLRHFRNSLHKICKAGHVKSFHVLNNVMNLNTSDILSCNYKAARLALRYGRLEILKIMLSLTVHMKSYLTHVIKQFDYRKMIRTHESADMISYLYDINIITRSEKIEYLGYWCGDLVKLKHN